MRVARTITVGAMVAMVLTGCAKTQVTGTKVASTPVATTTTTDSNFPTPDPSDLVVTPTPEETTQEAATEGKFGDTGSFTINDEPFEITVYPGVKAKCHYSDLSCDKPQTGDRVVNVPITVKNNGTGALEMDPNMFALEFADGTRVSSSDGNVYQYGPDNTLDYGQKVRVGGTLKTSITFEAPKGAYKIVFLSSSYNGDDLFIWK